MDIYNKNQIYVHTPCKVSVTFEDKYKLNDIKPCPKSYFDKEKYDTKIALMSNIKYMYFNEFFRKELKFYEDFFKELTILDEYISNENESENMKTFHASGTNDILIISSKVETESLNPENTTWCNLNKSFIDKFIANKETIFTKTYLELMFDVDAEMEHFDYNEKLALRYYDNDFIMRPNIILSFINKEFRNKIINFKENKQNNIIENYNPIYDTVFQVIIKPDNIYNELQKLWEKYIESNNDEIFQTLNNGLKNQVYVNIFNITNKQVDKLKRIYKSIIDFFGNKYGVPEENILINVATFHQNNLWLDINVEFRDVFKGDYKYIRLTQKHKMIQLKEIIDILEIYGNLDSISDKYQTTMRFSDVDKYNFIIGKSYYDYNDNKKTRNTTECIDTYKTPRNNRPPFVRININENLPTNIEMDINKNLENETTPKQITIISKNKIKNIKIMRVLQQKNSKLSSLCSASVCVTIDGHYFVVNIIPRTHGMLNEMMNRNPKKALDYLYNNNWPLDRCRIINREHIEHDILDLDYYKHYDLRYAIEIISINPYDCIGCYIPKSNDKNCDQTLKYGTRFTQEIALFNRQILLIPINENYTIAKQLESCYKKHFNMKMYLVIYNVIRNIIICYRNKKITFETAKEFISNIIDIESSFNQNKNIDKNYTLWKLLEDYIYETFYNSNTKEKIYVDNNSQFICVYAASYSLTKNNPEFKLLIWFTTPNITTEHDIKNVIENIKNMEGLNASGNGGFDEIDINKEQFKQIYNLDDNTIEDILTNNYLYNITSLFKSENTWHDFKYDLDLFIKNCTIHYDISNYNYTFYHYPTGYYTSTLHIHIFIKESINVGRNSVSPSNIMTIGRYGTFSHEFSDEMAHPYATLDFSWCKNHKILLRTVPIINIINNTFYQTNKQLIIDIHNENFNEKQQFINLLHDIDIGGLFEKRYNIKMLGKDGINYHNILMNYKNNVNILSHYLYSIMQ